MLVAIFVMLQIYNRYKSFHFKKNAYFAMFCGSAVYLIQWLYYWSWVVFLFQVPNTLEIAFVKEGGKQFPGLFLFTGPARMVRPVYNLAAKQVELVGTFEQVYMDICITQKEAHPNVS